MLGNFYSVVTIITKCLLKKVSEVVLNKSCWPLHYHHITISKVALLVLSFEVSFGTLIGRNFLKVVLLFKLPSFLHYLIIVFHPIFVL